MRVRFTVGEAASLRGRTEAACASRPAGPPLLNSGLPKSPGNRRFAAWLASGSALARILAGTRVAPSLNLAAERHPFDES